MRNPKLKKKGGKWRRLIGCHFATEDGSAHPIRAEQSTTKTSGGYTGRGQGTDQPGEKGTKEKMGVPRNGYRKKKPSWRRRNTDRDDGIREEEHATTLYVNEKN